MKKLLFVLLYGAVAVPPILFYTQAQFLWDAPSNYAWALSMALGILAFTLLAGQFFLAAKPKVGLWAFGSKGLQSFHGLMAVVAVVIAFLHRILKVGLGLGTGHWAAQLKAQPPTDPIGQIGATFITGLGMSDDTLQGRLGTIAWLGFGLVIVVTILLMAQTFWMKIPLLKNFKLWAQKSAGLTYPRLRLFHNLTLILVGVLAIHIWLASSSLWSLNPAGVVWLGGWLAFCLSWYLVYRLRQRGQKRSNGFSSRQAP